MRGVIVAAFLAGVAADWATYAGTALIMAAGIKGESAFWPLAGKIVLAFVPTQKPLAIADRLVLAGEPAVDDLLEHSFLGIRLGRQLLLRTRRYHSHSRRTCLGV